MDGTVEEVIRMEHESFTFFDITKDGTLILPAYHELMLISPDGERRTLVTGGRYLRDAKIGDNGIIYFVDYGLSAVYKLIPR